MAAKTSNNDSDFIVIIVVIAIVLMGVFGGGAAEDTEANGPGDDTESTSTEFAWAGETTFTTEDVDTLTVAKPNNHGYGRDNFGPAWDDVDDNGCDTRNDILARDLVDTTIDNDGCTVLSGTLHGPYTGKTINFTRDSSGGGIDVDHIRSLSDAWGAGAHAWTPEQRLAYANDPAVLISVDASENRAKSDKGPSEWLPKGRAAQCAYAAQYVHISNTYDLSISRQDKQALDSLAKVC